jgi:hypothetical protein
MLQPDRMGDDLRRKTEASVGVLGSSHGESLPKPPHLGNLTAPWAGIARAKGA